MAPRNPSELARLEEERLDLLEVLKAPRIPVRVYKEYRIAMDKGVKSIREGLLRELRRIEETLGIPSVPYNSSKFGEQK